MSGFTGDRKPEEVEKWFRQRDFDGNGFVNLTVDAPPLPIPMTDPKSRDTLAPKNDAAKPRKGSVPSIDSPMK